MKFKCGDVLITNKKWEKAYLSNLDVKRKQTLTVILALRQNGHYEIKWHHWHENTKTSAAWIHQFMTKKPGSIKDKLDYINNL